MSRAALAAVSLHSFKELLGYETAARKSAWLTSPGCVPASRFPVYLSAALWLACDEALQVCRYSLTHVSYSTRARPAVQVKQRCVGCGRQTWPPRSWRPSSALHAQLHARPGKVHVRVVGVTQRMRLKCDERLREQVTPVSLTTLLGIVPPGRTCRDSWDSPRSSSQNTRTPRRTLCASSGARQRCACAAQPTQIPRPPRPFQPSPTAS